MTYLWVEESFDSIACAFQRYTTYKKDEQEDIWESSCEIGGLKHDFVKCHTINQFFPHPKILIQQFVLSLSL